MGEVKMAVITGFLSKTKDRFREYNEEISLNERLRLVSQMNGIDGVEVVYPYEVQKKGDLGKLLTHYALKLSAINVNVKAEPEFLLGGLTSKKKETRVKAIRFIKEAKEMLGISYVLFIGDTTLIPMRKSAVTVITTAIIWNEILTDLYYADIYTSAGGFSSWDTNNDDIFGECYYGYYNLESTTPPEPKIIDDVDKRACCCRAIL